MIGFCWWTTSRFRSTPTTTNRSAWCSRRTSRSPSRRAEAGARGDTASGSVTKVAKLETGMEIRVPLFVKEGEKIKVHSESREFSGRA